MLEFDFLVTQAPNPGAFKKPMSKRCRQLLYDILLWGHDKVKTLHGVSISQILTVFEIKFNQLEYEELSLQYSLDKYAKTIANKRCKSLDDVIFYMALMPIKDDKWRDEHKIVSNMKIGSILDKNVSAVYTWVTQHFLLCDLSDHDLIKIIQLGRNHKLDIIKSSAAGIIDPSKKSISYLYSLVLGAASQQNAVKGIEQKYQQESNAKLAILSRLAEEASSSEEFSLDEDTLSRWSIDQVFIDTLRNK